MNDQERMADLLAMEKKLGNNYDIFCLRVRESGPAQRICQGFDQSHSTQTELFQAAQSRGWYQVEQAPMDKINQAKTKYTSSMPQ